MSVTFAKFHPNLIIGGTYSGQIVLWDNRSSKKTPVQRTPLSATAHTVSQTEHLFNGTLLYQLTSKGGRQKFGLVSLHIEPGYSLWKVLVTQVTNLC